MHKKNIIIISAAVLGLALTGAGTALAHGWFLDNPAETPQQTAQRYTTLFDQAASLLGISADEVKDAWAKGQSFQDLAEAKGISESDIQHKLKDLKRSQIEARLKTLVDQGVITQDQADQRLKFMQDRIDNNPDLGRHFGRMHGWLMR